MSQICSLVGNSENQLALLPESVPGLGVYLETGTCRGFGCARADFYPIHFSVSINASSPHIRNKSSFTDSRTGSASGKKLFLGCASPFPNNACLWGKDSNFPRISFFKGILFLSLSKLVTVGTCHHFSAPKLHFHGRVRGCFQDLKTDLSFQKYPVRLAQILS